MSPESVPHCTLAARAPQCDARGRGLAFRSTALILLLGGLVGSVVAWSSALLMERVERDRLTGLFNRRGREELYARLLGVERALAGLGLPFSVRGGVRVSIGASLGVVYTHYPPEKIGEPLRRGCRDVRGQKGRQIAVPDRFPRLKRSPLHVAADLQQFSTFHKQLRKGGLPHSSLN